MKKRVRKLTFEIRKLITAICDLPHNRSDHFLYNKIASNYLSGVIDEDDLRDGAYS